MALNSIPHYPISDLGTSYPSFTTSSGLNYFCLLDDVTNYSPIFGSYDIRIYEFMFSYSAASGSDSAEITFDPLILQSIAYILSDYLSDPNTVIVFRCDYSDGRQHKRFNRFDREFKKINTEGLIKIESRTVETEIEGSDQTVSYPVAAFYSAHFSEPKLLKDFLFDNLDAFLENK